MSNQAVPAPALGARAGRPALPSLPMPPFLRPLLAVGGSALLVLAGILPIWGSSLLAPQYPKGLALWFYGGRTEGPLREVNNLNHYIGMRPIDMADVPEMALWPLVLVACGLLLVTAVFVRGWIGRLAAIALFLVPVVILADIQRYLIIYGSQLDPGSALRLDPFVPLVVGPSTVWNFTIWTYPGPSLLLIWAVAALAILARRGPAVGRSASISAAIGALALVVAGTLLIVVPAVRPEAAQASSVGPPPASMDLAAAIAAAPAGATVVVPAGSYFVHLELRKPVTLLADGEVLLEGNGRGTVVTIAADDVTIRGFRIGGTGGQVEDAAAIRTEGARRIRIEGNRLERFFTGVWVNGGGDVSIVGNELAGSGQVLTGADHSMSRDEGSAGPTSAPAGGAGATGSGGGGSGGHAGHGEGAGPGGQGDGISLWAAQGILVRENQISGVRDGVYVNYANEVLIDSNVTHHSRYAVHAMFGEDLTVFGNSAVDNVSGLVFMYSKRVLAGRNLLAGSQEAGIGHGVVLKDVAGVRLAENRIERNRVGIQVDGTVHGDRDEALVVRNRIAANGVGIALFATADLAFGANDFDGNLTQVLALEPGVDRHNDWTNGGTGNYWSDYAGLDLDHDGIGDLPYTGAGVGGVLFAMNPGLEAYRASLAVAVLDTAQAIFEAARPPVVRDFSPRLAAPVDLVSPPGSAPVTEGGHAGHGQAAAVGGSEARATGGGVASLGWSAAGALLLVAALGGFVGGVRTRAPVRPSMRTPHPVAASAR